MKTIVQQDVLRAPMEYAFSSGSGIANCVKQLNNINSVLGSCFLQTHLICQKLGIDPRTTKEPIEDSKVGIGLKALLDDVKTNIPKSVDTTHLETKISVLQEEIQDLKKIIASFNPEVLHKILTVVESIDSKT